jgi:hypothetical protein
VSRDREGPVALEDRLAGDILDRLNESVLPAPNTSDDTDVRMLRSYLEIVGLLPYELDPAEPSPATKERLMASLSGEGGSWRLSKAEDVAVPSSIAGAGRWKRWALPLAAGLVLALLGVSGWQRVHMGKQQEEIAQISGQLRRLSPQAGELARYRQELEEAQAKLSVLAASGVEVCSLHPMEERLAEAPPTATLFVAPDHQHWYLRIDSLEPSPEDRAYQLWFITDRGTKVSAGTFDPRPGVRTELTSTTMPGGTIAVSITVEPLGGSPEPSSPPLLYGDEVMRIL